MESRWISLVSGLVVALAAISGGGCHPANYRPDLATREYPWTLHRTQDVPIQCFREGSTVQILNSTPRGYDSVAIWINQRFLLEGVDLPAGESTMIDLWQFRDHLGEQFRAGGIWRTEPPMPVRLIEIQADPESPTVGLIAIPPREL